MSEATKWIVAVSVLLAGMGFLFPFWPLSIIGILLCALSGRYVYAVGIALLLDVAWGAPVGDVAFLHLPSTLLAVLAALLRYGGDRYLWKAPKETL